MGAQRRRGGCLVAIGGLQGSKRETARFYFARILPRIHTHAATIRAGADVLLAMPDAQFG